MLTCNLKAFKLPNLPVENVGKQFYSKGSENFDPSHLAINWAKNHLWRVKLFSIGVSTYSDSAKLNGLQDSQTMVFQTIWRHYHPIVCPILKV